MGWPPLRGPVRLPRVRQLREPLHPRVRLGPGRGLRGVVVSSPEPCAWCGSSCDLAPGRAWSCGRCGAVYWQPPEELERCSSRVSARFGCRSCGADPGELCRELGGPDFLWRLGTLEAPGWYVEGSQVADLDRSWRCWTEAQREAWREQDRADEWAETRGHLGGLTGKPWL